MGSAISKRLRFLGAALLALILVGSFAVKVVMVISDSNEVIHHSIVKHRFIFSRPASNPALLKHIGVVNVGKNPESSFGIHDLYSLCAIERKGFAIDGQTLSRHQEAIVENFSVLIAKLEWKLETFFMLQGATTKPHIRDMYRALTPISYLERDEETRTTSRLLDLNSGRKLDNFCVASFSSDLTIELPVRGVLRVCSKISGFAPKAVREYGQGYRGGHQAQSKGSKRDRSPSEPPIKRRLFVMLVSTVVGFLFVALGANRLYDTRKISGGALWLGGFTCVIGGFVFLLLGAYKWSWGWWI